MFCCYKTKKNQKWLVLLMPCYHDLDSHCRKTILFYWYWIKFIFSFFLFTIKTGAMIACKLAAMVPEKVLSLGLLNVTGGGFECFPKVFYIFWHHSARLSLIPFKLCNIDTMSITWVQSHCFFPIMLNKCGRLKTFLFNIVNPCWFQTSNSSLLKFSR